MPDYTHTLKAFRRSVIETERACGHDPTEYHVNRRIANNLIVTHHWGALEQHYAETADDDVPPVKWQRIPFGG